MTESIKISSAEARRLLGAASPDAALLYLYIKSGNSLEGAERDLQMTPSRISCAGATLRQLGRAQEEKPATVMPGESPQYSGGTYWKPWMRICPSAVFMGKSSGCWAGA